MKPPDRSQPSSPVPSGRVRHDDRGKAVWDWLKETGRHALESTSRLLKKLESPQLEVEDKKDEGPHGRSTVNAIRARLR